MEARTKERNTDETRGTKAKERESTPSPVNAVLFLYPLLFVEQRQGKFEERKKERSAERERAIGYWKSVFL